VRELEATPCPAGAGGGPKRPETLYQWLHSGYTAKGKKKGQPVRVGLSSLGTRMVSGFPLMVPGAGLEPARLAAGDFESPESTNFTTRAGIREDMNYGTLLG
jgi:hypothetical protein